MPFLITRRQISILFQTVSIKVYPIARMGWLEEQSTVDHSPQSMADTIDNGESKGAIHYVRGSRDTEFE